MPINLNFAQVPDGTPADAFIVFTGPPPSAPIPLFAETKAVAAGVAAFTTIGPPGTFAFRLRSPVGVRWRSGALSITSTSTDTFLPLDVCSVSQPPPACAGGVVVISPTTITGFVPPLPITSGSLSVTSMTLAVGQGSITATGAGTVATGTFLGTVPIGYTYVFTLAPDTNLLSTGTVVDVSTISLNITAAVGGLLGFLLNLIIAPLAAILTSFVTPIITARLQAAVDAAVAGMIATSSAPPGTTVTAESVRITAATGVSVKVWAGLDVNKLCPSNPSGGGP